MLFQSGVELVLRQILLPFGMPIASLSPMPGFMIGSRARFQKNSIKSSINGLFPLLNKLIHEVELGMDDYDLALAVEPFVGFIDQLTNWYIRRSAAVSGMRKTTPDRDQAFATLYYVLLELCKIAASYIPFISESIYQNLADSRDAHFGPFVRFSRYQKERRRENLEAEMEAVQSDCQPRACPAQRK